jgi:hypothetical protein
MRLSVLMTVYNEAEFLDYAIRGCLPHVDDLVIVEGAYQESVKVGASERSTDGTCAIIKKWLENQKSFADAKIIHAEANEHTDKDQRNVGLTIVKKLNQHVNLPRFDPSQWLLIIDGDEVYEPKTFELLRGICKRMEVQQQYAAYLTSLTFVNDLKHYTTQEFPRLFKVTPGSEFVNDNFMVWKERNFGWSAPHVIKLPHIKYYHYAFCKNKERFLLKKKWWETRFGRPFDYGWHIDDEGKIKDPNHKIYEFTGKHPDVMRDHPLHGT